MRRSEVIDPHVIILMQFARDRPSAFMSPCVGSAFGVGIGHLGLIERERPSIAVEVLPESLNAIGEARAIAARRVLGVVFWFHSFVCFQSSLPASMPELGVRGLHSFNRQFDSCTASIIPELVYMA